MNTPTAVTFSFGPFELDGRTRRLTRQGEPVPVSDRHVEILLELAAHGGEVVSKDALVEAAWKGVAVTHRSGNPEEMEIATFPAPSRCEEAAQSAPSSPRSPRSTSRP